jgi:hypothetical protein
VLNHESEIIEDSNVSGVREGTAEVKRNRLFRLRARLCEFIAVVVFVFVSFFANHGHSPITFNAKPSEEQNLNA